MHRRENPLCDLEGPRAGCSRDSASVQAESKRSRAKPDRSSLRVSPFRGAPGLAARSGTSLGLMLTLRYGRSAAVSYGVRTRFDGHADTRGTIGHRLASDRRSPRSEDAPAHKQSRLFRDCVSNRSSSKVELNAVVSILNSELSGIERTLDLRRWYGEYSRRCIHVPLGSES
jgi:hypothetical protein